MTYVYMRSIPMGFVGAVDVMQAMARQLVFETCGVDSLTELHKQCPLPAGDISVVCMDGFDSIRRLKVDEAGSCGSQSSPEHYHFVEACHARNIPRNAAKRLVASIHGSLLGGEIDGKRGCLASPL